jgi:diaminopimelate decarboxylase
MFVEDCFGIKNGVLTIDGSDTTELAKNYGTPLYVMSESCIRKNCKKYKSAIDKYYDGKGLALYASKAFSAVGIYKIAKEEGLGVDVVSGGELYTALKAGFPVTKIYFHGNNKTDDELRMAIENNVGHIVVDN